VLATVPAAARAALERQAARALMQTGTPPVEIAAQLAAGAQPGDDEAIELLLAAGRSLATWNAGDAAEMLTRAIGLMAAGDPRRAGVVAEAVTLLQAAGEVDQASALAGGALRGLLPADQEAEVQYGLAGLTGLSADMRVAAGRRALELPGLSAPTRARHLARLLHNLVAAGRRTEAHALLDAATEQVRAHGDDAAVYSLRFALGGLTYQDGDFGLALLRLEEAIRDGGASSGGERASLGQHWRCEVLIVVDRFDEASAVATDALATARREGQDWVARSWERFLGRQHHRVGEHALAVSALERELPDDPRRAELSMINGGTVDALAGAALHLGDRALEQRCAAVARTMLELGPPAVQRQGAWILARQAMAAGDPQGGCALLLGLDVPDGESILPPSPAEVTDAPQLVRMALAAGELGLARRAVAFAVTLARRNPSVPSVVGAAAHARGLLEDDRGALRLAIAELERSPRRPALASALEDAAVAEAATGDREAAVRDLGRALDLLAAMGAVTDTARVRRRLRALGVVRRAQPVERPSTGWSALTEAELSVVGAIAAGMTNREAAEHLFLSPHTINAHLRNVFAKLGINSRVELARLATVHGVQVPALLVATG
jgi:DNA-binding CsgD family transcriptional regulator